MLSFNNDMIEMMLILSCSLKMKPGRTSDERQFHKYPHNGSKTPIQMSGPHPSAHVMPADNLVIHQVLWEWSISKILINSCRLLNYLYQKGNI